MSNYLAAQQRKKNVQWVAKTAARDKKLCQVLYEQESSYSKLNEEKYIRTFNLICSLR